MNGISQTGRIVKIDSGFFYAKDSGKLIECRASGRLRKCKICPIVGDIVDLVIDGQGNGYITSVRPRKNLLMRPKLSNIDQVLVMVSCAQPKVNVFTLSKFLAFLCYFKIDLAIVVTKPDLATPTFIHNLYSNTGFKILNFNGKTLEGLEDIQNLMKGQLTALAGDSGVGKTTLVNAVSPELALEVGSISSKLGRGRHMTRHSEIFEFWPGSFVVDTPGFSKVDELIALIEPKDLANCFPEFVQFLGSCKFSGCTHTAEEGCSVIQSVKFGQINKIRYEHFVAIWDLIKAHAKN